MSNVSSIMGYGTIEQIGLLTEDGRDKEGLFLDGETSEVTFHHSYDWIRDDLTIALSLKSNPKSRGKSTGPPLSETDVNQIPVTKAIIAHLCGQGFQVVGSFLDPVLIGFKILFSRSCQLVTN